MQRLPCRARLAVLFFVLLLAGCAQPYVPPVSGPVATLKVTTAVALRGQGEAAIGGQIWEEGNCSTQQSLGTLKQLTIRAGKPMVIRRSFSNVVPLGPVTVFTSCGEPLRFVPEEGETYETRFVNGLWGCRASILRIGAQGRTEVLPEVIRPEERC